MSLTSRRQCLLVLLLWSLAPRLMALDFCVSTAQEFTTAVTTAALTASDDHIQLQTGTYALTQRLEYLPGSVAGGNLTVSGGWNAGCASRQSPSPYDTVVLTGLSPNNLQFASGEGTITIRGIHFGAGSSVGFRDRGGVPFNCSAQGQQFVVSHSIFDGAFPDTHMGRRLSFSSKCHRVRVENSLFVGDSDGTAIDALVDLPLVLINNTVVSSDVGLDIATLVPFISVYLANNIVWNNLSADLRAGSIGGNSIALLATANTWANEVLGSGAQVVARIDHLTTDPLLDGSHEPISPTSPSLNSGSVTVQGGLPDTDLLGRARLTGVKPDRGVFESPIGPGDVILVSSTANDGPGSLRDAIITANSVPGHQTIQFDIAGACPRQIALQTELPGVIDSLIIDGYSQPGSSANTLAFGSDANICINLLGSSGLGWGLRVNGGSLFAVQGLNIGQFGTAVIANSPGDTIIRGNRLGYPSRRNTNGVVVLGPAESVIVGGASPASRNTISNNTRGVVVDSGAVEIVNNYIGTTPEGQAALGNEDGIWLRSDGTIVSENLISGNDRDGILLTGSASFGANISGNRIGLGNGLADPSLFGNGGAGIRISDGANANSIGGAGLFGLGEGPGNKIANNAIGIMVETGRTNRISRNSIFGNMGLGVDLDEQGVAPNDGDGGLIAPDLANRLLDYPVLVEAQIPFISDPPVVEVSGFLDTVLGDYEIELFASAACDPSGHGEGEFFIGATETSVVAPGGIGSPQPADFSFLVERSILVERPYLTATASDGGNTSEFSSCLSYGLDENLFLDSFESQ